MFFARQNVYEFPRESENLSSRVPPTDFASFAGIIIMINHDFVLPQALYQNNSNDNIASAATAYSPQTNQ